MRYLLIVLFFTSACSPKWHSKQQHPLIITPPNENVPLVSSTEKVDSLIVSIKPIIATNSMITLEAPLAKKVELSILQQQQLSSQIQQQQKQQTQQKQQKQAKQRQKTLTNKELQTKALIEGKSELMRPRITGPTQFDSRIDPWRLDHKVSWQSKILRNASSIGIVIEKDKIHSVTDTSFQLDISMTLKGRFKLCPEEAFANQPVIGIGTAFIIGSNQMATASHVFTEQPENYLVIFGFEMLNAKGDFNAIISKKNIYHPKKIVHKDTDSDLVIFEVEEDLNKPILTVAKNKSPAVDTEIYMIGFPSGLPQKVALNAEVQENNHPQYFYTSLDAFQGNSGSPVFNMTNHEVIGILVSGEVDYIWNGSCNKSSLCRFPYCKGEKVMKLLNIEDYIAP